MDTSVVIDYPAGAVAARFSLAAVGTTTLAQLSYGSHTADPRLNAAREQRCHWIANALDPIPFDTRAARIYRALCATVRAVGRDPQLRRFDLFIAAVAVEPEIPLITSNEGDFAGVQHTGCRSSLFGETAHREAATVNAAPRPPKVLPTHLLQLRRHRRPRSVDISQGAGPVSSPGSQAADQFHATAFRLFELPVCATHSANPTNTSEMVVDAFEQMLVVAGGVRHVSTGRCREGVSATGACPECRQA